MAKKLHLGKTIPKELSDIYTEKDELTALIETDMLPVVYDKDGKILTDESGKIILRY